MFYGIYTKLYKKSLPEKRVSTRRLIENQFLNLSIEFSNLEVNCFVPRCQMCSSCRDMWSSCFLPQNQFKSQLLVLSIKNSIKTRKLARLSNLQSHYCMAWIVGIASACYCYFGLAKFQGIHSPFCMVQLYVFSTMRPTVIYSQSTSPTTTHA